MSKRAQRGSRTAIPMRQTNREHLPWYFETNDLYQLEDWFLHSVNWEIILRSRRRRNMLTCSLDQNNSQAHIWPSNLEGKEHQRRWSHRCSMFDWPGRQVKSGQAWRGKASGVRWLLGSHVVIPNRRKPWWNFQSIVEHDTPFTCPLNTFTQETNMNLFSDGNRSISETDAFTETIDPFGNSVALG